MSGYTKQISFRIAEEHSEELERRAKMSGKSQHEYAREILIAVLTRSPAEETRNRVAEVQDELHRLREDLHTSVVGLMMMAGKATLEDATEFVANKLS